ncbi:MAG: PTS sugar transporter subunit IIC [Deltaproteobacteria bacterium]|nr:PTS sugar transporter subunit IIC [Deltaproteobacteria bacterium]
MLAKELLYDSFLVSFAASFLSLDRTAAFQTMVSRPIVTAPVIGWCIGDITTGLVAGVLTELLCMSDLPLGGHVPRHETALAALTTAGAVFISRASPDAYSNMWDKGIALMPIAVLIAMPAESFLRMIDTRVRRLNVRFFEDAARTVESGETGTIAKDNMKGLLLFFALPAAGFFTATLFVGWGAGLFSLLLIRGEGLGAYLAYAALITISAAYALSGFNAKRCEYAFWGAVAFCTAFLALEL